MKKITKFFKLTLLMGMMATVTTFAQTLPIDPAQREVIIDETIPGQLEAIINGDVDATTGLRANPDRIYILKNGAIYQQQASINFGKVGDEAATLTIVAEDLNGVKPMIIRAPVAGGKAFENFVMSNLTLKNLYMGVSTTSNTASNLFKINGTNQRMIIEGLVTENCINGGIFQMRSALGLPKVYLRNCYFRDNTQFANSWNHGIFQRGDNGEAFDTLWVENCTVSNSGMPYFGKFNPIKFFFFNHNTIVNNNKYPIWFHRFVEGYVCNNLFINSHNEGECNGARFNQIGEDFVWAGLIMLDTTEAAWFKDFPDVTGLDAVGMNNCKFIASNNLRFVDKEMDKYWNGEYDNDPRNYPLSNRWWDPIDAAVVANVPAPIPQSYFIKVNLVKLFNARDSAIAKGWPNNVKLDSINYDGVDPDMITKGMRGSQLVGDQFANFIRSGCYGIDTVSWDKSLMYFGDRDANTVPGGGTEDGYSITDMTDMPENFAYNKNIKSKIDGFHLGSLAWFPSELKAYNSDSALVDTRKYYDTGKGTDRAKDVIISINKKAIDVSPLAIYPNPAASQISLNKDCSKVVISNTIGQAVITLKNYKSGNAISINGLTKGMYFVSNGVSTSKLIVK